MPRNSLCNLRISKVCSVKFFPPICFTPDIKKFQFCVKLSNPVITFAIFFSLFLFLNQSLLIKEKVSKPCSPVDDHNY